MADMSLKVDSY